MSPLSTSSAWRTRAGTDVSETTRCPSAASVEQTIVDSTKALASAMPGKTRRPAPRPASIVSGRPMSRSRLGQPRCRRRRARSIRVESLNRRKTRASSQNRSAVMLSRWMFTSLRADVPTQRPAAVKIMAEVMPRASSGLETAPYRMRITAMVMRATNMRPPLAGVREDQPHGHCLAPCSAGLSLCSADPLLAATAACTMSQT